MAGSHVGVRARVLLATAVASAGMAGLGAAPAAADVSSVTGSACGYYAEVGLLGSALDRRGCGQSGTAPATAASPSVTLPPAGSGNLPISASDPDGATGEFGPAVIFGGRSPEGSPSGPLSVTTRGLTGPTGSVTSSASVVLNTQPNPNIGGIGPGPMLADEGRSTCTANESGVSGSATFVNGTVVLKTDPQTGNPSVIVPIPANPTPNYTVAGQVDVGDDFRIVFNEQVIGPDSITVNAAHMYLLGPTARGELVVAQSHCGIVSNVANGTPVANADSYSTPAGQALTVPAAGLLANDTDPNGHSLTATAAQAVFVPGPNHPAESTGNTYIFPSLPAHGSATINPNGSFTYTPNAGYVGPDSFKYVARDPRGANSAATVAINVIGTAKAAVADFTGDGATDVSVFRPSSGTWYVRNGLTAGWGTNGDIPVPGDYNGNGTTDVAVFRPSTGTWFVQGGATTGWGTNGDVPVPGDYNGDKSTDIAVFRGGTWYIRLSGGGDQSFGWGTTGDIAVPGDYDGNGTTEAAVFRPSTGTWFVRGGVTTGWGTSGDIPVPGDYNGNGTTDIAVFRPSTGTWFVQGGATTGWGTSGDIPVPGDYNANGTTDIAVFRPSTGTWFVQGGLTTGWGTNGDIPLPLAPSIRMRFF